MNEVGETAGEIWEAEVVKLLGCGAQENSPDQLRRNLPTLLSERSERTTNLPF